MDTELTKTKNRCINCVYLCWHGGNTLSECDEIPDKTRLEQIAQGNWGESNREHLSATCPSKGWRHHTDGSTPQISFQREQHSKTLKWAIAGVCISGVVLALTLFFGILNLPSC